MTRWPRVLRKDGNPIPNLYAGGGVAVGVSGSGVKGYMSGNGLLAATVLGKLAGEAAGLAIKDGEWLNTRFSFQGPLGPLDVRSPHFLSPNGESRVREKGWRRPCLSILTKFPVLS